MNRYKYLFILCLVSEMLLSVTSCVDKSSLIGQGVSFKVTSTSAATKAAYSNSYYDEGSQKYERIEWRKEDKIAIFSPEVSKPKNKSSVFTVEGVTNDGRKSKASVKSSNDLFWGEAVLHHFYAVYPAPETDGSSVTISLARNSVSGNIQEDQSNYLSKGTGKDPNGKEVTIELVPNLKKYMMMAGWTSTEPTPDPIDIDFSPLTTCIDFTIKNDTSDPLDIKRITLSSSSSEAYSGGYTYSFSENSFTEGSVGNCVSMNFPKAGTVSIAKDETLRFKFFLNPCNDIKNPVFTIVDHNGVKRETTIKPKEGVFEIKSGHKKIITGLLIPNSVVWTEMSFKEPVVTKWTESKEDFGLEPEYTYVLEGLDNLQDVNFVADGCTEEKLGPIKSYKIKYDDKDTKIPVVPVVSGAPDWAKCSVVKDDTKPDPTYNIVFSNVGQNTESESHAQKLKAADQKGTADNPFDLSYYNPATGSTSTTQKTANCYVVNAPGYYKFPLKEGNSTTTVSATDAAVLWQDVSGMVVDVGVADNYIKFHIVADKIQQANALIAGKNSSGTILWSWHIWVTDENLTVSPTESPNRIMPVNLGWVADASSKTYVPRSGSLTVSFTETGGPFKDASKNIIVSQDALPNTAVEKGTSPYYQWGRKDPFREYSTFSKRQDLSTSIKNPTTLYGESSYEEWCFSPDEYWKSNKSVYDPCPVGFKVLTKSSALNIKSFYDKLPKLGRLIVSGLDLKAESPKYYYWVTGDTNFNSYNSHYSSAAIYDGNCSCTYQTTSICFGFSVRPEFE